MSDATGCQQFCASISEECRRKVVGGEVVAFPQDYVTSNLASTIAIARSWSRPTQCGESESKRPKSFVFWILICKFFDIKILRTLFANMLGFTRMFIGFREKQGEGGTPLRYALQNGNMLLSRA